MPDPTPMQRAIEAIEQPLMHCHHMVECDCVRTGLLAAAPALLAAIVGGLPGGDLIAVLEDDRWSEAVPRDRLLAALTAALGRLA